MVPINTIAMLEQNRFGSGLDSGISIRIHRTS